MLIVENLVIVFVLFAIHCHHTLASFSDYFTTDRNSPENAIDWDFSRERGTVNCADGSECDQPSDSDSIAGNSDKNIMTNPSDHLRRFLYAIPNGNQADADGKKYVYLNYKKAYGIRYDPNNDTKSKVANDQKGRKCNQTYNTPGLFETDLTTLSPLTTTNTIAVPTSTATSNSSIIATTERPTAGGDVNKFNPSQASSTTSRPFPRPTKDNTIVKSSNNITNITLPGTYAPARGYIRNMIDYIGDKIKQIFTYGLQLSLPLPQQGGPRFLNLFNVIKFENTPCTSSETMLSEMSGTCYHDEECRDMGGIVIDNCADGFGVCCAC